MKKTSSMKTRHALLTFVFLPAITWGSNINESMLQEDRIWFYQYKLSVNPELGDMFRYSEMTLRGDTLIDGAKYKKVLSREVTESREPIGDWQPDFLFLNDTNGKIFMYDERSKSRCQLLDLTAEEGESVTGFSLPWIVSEVKDTIFSYSSDLSVRHSLSVTTTDEPNRTDIWVEGIGSLTYGIIDYSNFEGSSVVLLSCIQGSEVLYMHKDVTTEVTWKDMEKMTGKGLYHDLQGRRLADKPQRGVYIKDGRKVIIR